MTAQGGWGILTTLPLPNALEQIHGQKAGLSPEVARYTLELLDLEQQGTPLRKHRQPRGMAAGKGPVEALRSSRRRAGLARPLLYPSPPWGRKVQAAQGANQRDTRQGADRSREASWHRQGTATDCLCTEASGPVILSPPRLKAGGQPAPVGVASRALAQAQVGRPEPTELLFSR